MIRTNLKTFTVVGRVGADPEVKVSPSGKNLAKFSVAVNEWDPESKTEVTTWVRCSAWETQADYVAANVRRGMRVFVSGQHSIYNGDSGEQEQLNVKAIGSASNFTTADEDEWA